MLSRVRWRKPYWYLESEARRNALRVFTTRKMLRRSLKENPRPKSTLQRLLDGYIRGRAPAIENQNLEELTATVQVVSWLEGTPSLEPLELPWSDAVLRRISWLRFRRALDASIGKYFRGRKEELDLIHEFVNGDDDKPLMFYGVGGIGKTSLLAKYIHRDLLQGDGLRLPMAYLDFDRVALLPDRPVTLLLEIVRQIKFQYQQALSYVEVLEHEMREAEFDVESTKYTLTSRQVKNWMKMIGEMLMEISASDPRFCPTVRYFRRSAAAQSRAYCPSVSICSRTPKTCGRNSYSRDLCRAGVD